MEDTVCAAIFTYVDTFRHPRPDAKPTKMQESKLKVANLAQISTLPEWGGRNLGGILLDHCITHNLIQYDFDLMIICGCAEGFYRDKMKYDKAPSWLKSPPWNIASPDTRDVETYNRDIFFYVPLTTHYEDNLEAKHAKGQQFSFRHPDKTVNQYLGNDAVENKDDGVDNEASALIGRVQI
jgi:hypothetical protein